MYNASVPINHNETKHSVYRVPCEPNADYVECPTCLDVFLRMSLPVSTSSKSMQLVGSLTFPHRPRANHLLPTEGLGLLLGTEGMDMHLVANVLLSGLVSLARGMFLTM